MANSTAVITDLATLSTTQPTAPSITKAKSSGIDLPGMMEVALEAATDLRTTLGKVAAALDSADPALAQVNNILATLA